MSALSSCRQNMNLNRVLRLFAALSVFLCTTAARAVDPTPPAITNINGSGATKNLRFPLYPAAQAYTIQSATNVTQNFSNDSNFYLAAYTNIAGGITNIGYEWRRTNSPSSNAFFRVQVTPLSSNALLTATVLNRLTYGPTPDDLTNIAAIGPQAFIDQQLAPWTITEDVENTHTNFPIIQDLFVEATNFVWRTN